MTDLGDDGVRPLSDAERAIAANARSRERQARSDDEARAFAGRKAPDASTADAQAKDAADNEGMAPPPPAQGERS
jgi:hypothetical protein